VKIIKIKYLLLVLCFLVVLPIAYSGSINISCYQETANVSTACGGLSTGKYETGGYYTYDAFPFLAINYTKPITGNIISALWQVKHGVLSTYNVTIPSSCISYNSSTVMLRFITKSLTTSWGECLNSSGWNIITSVEYNPAGGGYNTLDGKSKLYDGSYSTYSAGYYDGISTYTFISSTTSNSASRVYEEAIYWIINDTTNPQIAYQGLSTASGYRNLTWIYVNMSINDTYYNSTNITLYKNGVYNTSVNTNFTNFTSLTEANWTTNITVTDLAGNSNTTSRSYIIDTTKPSVSYDSSSSSAGPSPGYIYVNLSVSDTNYNATNITLYKSGVYQSSVNTNSTNFTGLSDGSYTTNVTVSDLAGNTNTTSRSYTVDSTYPQISFNANTSTVGYRNKNWIYSSLNVYDLNLKWTQLLFYQNGSYIDLQNTNNLVGSFKLDNTNYVSNSTTNTILNGVSGNLSGYVFNHGTRQGGQSGSYFDGTGQRIVMNNSYINLTQDMSFSLDYKHITNPAIQFSEVYKISNSSATFMYIFVYTNISSVSYDKAVLKIYNSSGGNKDIELYSNASLKGDINLMLLFNSTNIDIYINGVYDKTSTLLSGTDYSTNKYNYIGTTSNPKMNFYNLKFYNNKKLNSSEITAIYNAGKCAVSPIGDKLIAQYILCNQSEMNAEGLSYAESQYSNSTTVYDTNNMVEGRSGKGSVAYKFDNNKSYIVLRNGTPFINQNNSFAISTYVYMNTNISNVHIVNKLYGSVFGGRAGSLVTGISKIQIVCPLNTTATTSIQTNTKNLKQWYHVVGQWNNVTGNCSIWIDGVLENSIITNAGAVNGTPTGTTRSFIGTELDTVTPLYFNGSISDVMIFNRTLTATEISELYNDTFFKNKNELNISGLTDNQYNLSAYAEDYSGNRNTTEVRSYTIDTVNPQLAYQGLSTASGYRNLTWIYVNLSVNDTNYNATDIILYRNGVYNNSVGLCYQESANVSTPCGGLNTGSYSIYYGMSAEQLANVTDGNWNTNTTLSSSLHDLYDVVYGKPINANGAIITMKTNGDGIVNVTVPQWCWDINSTHLNLKLGASFGSLRGRVVYCNNTVISSYYSGSSLVYSEDAIWWTIGTTTGNFTSLSDGSYTTNVTVSDLAGNTNTTSRSYTIDSTNPSIAYQGLSTASGYVNKNWIYVNLSINDTNYNSTNITLYKNGVYNTSVNTNFTNFTSLTDGNWSTNVSVTDLSGNRNTTSRSYITDTLNPQLAYQGLSTASGYRNLTWIYVNLSVNDTNYNSTNITLYKNGIYNTSVNTNVTNFTSLTGAVWSTNITVTDLSGNRNTTSRSYIIDTVKPQVAYQGLSTSSGDVNTNFIFVNLSINDTYYNSTNITLYKNGVYNTSVSTNSTTFTDLTDGNYTTNITVTDLAGNINNTISRSYFIDITVPTITATSNFNLSNWFYRNITAQFNLSDQELFSWNITLDGTQIAGASNVAYDFYSYNFTKDPKTMTVGTHTLNVRVADGHTAESIEDYNVKKGGWFDDASLEFKTEGNVINVVNENKDYSDVFNFQKNSDRYQFTFTPAEYTSDGEYSLKIVTKKIQEIVIKPNTEYKTWIVSGDNWIDFVSEDIQMDTLKIEAIDNFNSKVTFKMKPKSDNTGYLEKPIEFNSVGDLNIVTYNYTFYTLNYTLINQPSALEQQPNTYQISINTTNTLISYNDVNATLVYNNTAYPVIKTSDVNSIIFTATLDTPSIATATNVSINWSISVINNPIIVINSTQLITPINIGDCSTNPTWTKALDIYTKDEEYLTNLSNTSIDMSLNVLTGSGTAVSYGIQLRNSGNYSICVSPAGASYLIDAKIDYRHENYSIRKYYLNNYSVNNVTDSLTLYLLDEDVSSNIITTVYDKSTGTIIPGAFVKMLRYYPALGYDDAVAYKTVEVEQTDIDGKTEFKAVLADVWYKFIVEYPVGEVILTTDIAKILTTSNSLGISASTDPNYVFNTVVGVESAVTCDLGTAVCRFTWNNPTGITVKGELRIYLDTGFTQILKYSSSVESSAATIAYQLPTNISEDKYVAEGWIYVQE
jgi:hypothetical protein